MLQAVFIFVAGGADETSRSVSKTPTVEVTTVGVKDYAEAVEVAKEFYQKGCGAIELCGGFGHKGVAMIAEAVNYEIPIGVVRFDIHPGLDNQSGDKVF